MSFKVAVIDIAGDGTQGVRIGDTEYAPGSIVTVTDDQFRLLNAGRPTVARITPVDATEDGAASVTSGAVVPERASVGAQHYYTCGAMAGRVATLFPGGWVIGEAAPINAGGDDPFWEYPAAMKDAGGWYTLHDVANKGLSDYFGNVCPTWGPEINTAGEAAAYFANPGYATVPAVTAANGGGAILFDARAQADMIVGSSIVDWFTVSNASSAANTTIWGSRDDLDAKDYFRVVALSNTGIRVEANSAVGPTKINSVDSGTNVYTGTDDNICITIDAVTKIISVFSNGVLIRDRDMSVLNFAQVTMDHALGGAGGDRSVATCPGRYKNYGRMYWGQNALPGTAQEIATALHAYQSTATADSRPPKKLELPISWR